jgi:hypothetical protein
MIVRYFNGREFEPVEDAVARQRRSVLYHVRPRVIGCVGLKADAAGVCYRPPVAEVHHPSDVAMAAEDQRLFPATCPFTDLIAGCAANAALRDLF